MNVPVNLGSSFGRYEIITIEVLDKDGGLSGEDDVIDINPDLGQTALILNVDPITGHWYTAYPNSTWPSSSVSGILDGDSGGTINFNIQSDFLRSGQDADGDGLLNTWEVNGIDADGDGSIDFRLDGADPLHKDIFLEVDAMTNRAPAILPGITQISNTSPIEVTSLAHGLSTGTRVRIAGVT